MVPPDFTNSAIRDLISLTGRRAVVTGGAGGIGLAISKRFAEAGASVAVADIDAAGATKAAAMLTETYGTKAVGVEVDLSQEAQVVRLAERATQELGGIDTWVNNAAIYPMKPILDVTVDDWQRVHDLNLRGVFLCSREAAKRMIDAGHRGVIINISSVSGFRGRPKMGNYVASKHGVVGLTRSMAAELGPKGIRVLSIAPTLIATPGVTGWRTNASDPTVAGTDLEKNWTSELPLGRTGVPDDIARVALFCASDMAALMTGSDVAVDAGAMCN